MKLTKEDHAQIDKEVKEQMQRIRDDKYRNAMEDRAPLVDSDRYKTPKQVLESEGFSSPEDIRRYYPETAKKLGKERSNYIHRIHGEMLGADKLDRYMEIYTDRVKNRAER